MNREQKLALIIGFAVILVVGVLVSDHLSAAQSLRLADATEGDTGRVEARPVAMLPDPGHTGTRLAAGNTPTNTPSAQDQYREPVVQAREATQQPTLELPDEIVRITQGSPSTLGGALEGLQLSDPKADDSVRPIIKSDDLGTRIARGFDNGLPIATKLEQPGQRQDPASGTVREVSTPPVVRHTVAKDESLYKIAARYLGDGNRWREIAKANRGKVDSDGGVRQGVTLVIPDAKPLSQPALTSPPKKDQSPRTRPSPTTYTVAKNDSLGQIAQDLLGSVRYMNEIIRANPGKISDPDDIRVGMVLNIPARS